MKTEIDQILDNFERLLYGRNPKYKIPEIAKAARTEAKNNIQKLVDAAVIEAQQEVVDKLPDCAGCTYDKDEGTHSELSKQHFAEMNLNQLRAKRSE